MINVLKGMLFFAVFAPPLGGIMLGFAMAIIDPVPVVGVIDLIQVALTFALFSYLYGGIPALLTGAIAGFIQRRFRPFVAALAIGGLGLALSISLQYNNPSNLSDNQFWLTFGAPAFFSGILVSLFSNRALIVPSGHNTLQGASKKGAKNSFE